MQMDALRLFCDVADTRSFTDAARLNGCTLANASHQFHAVEKAHGQPLAVPGIHRVQLNAAGHVSYDYCRQIVGLAVELEVQVAKVKASGLETLHIAACPSIGLHRLPPLLHRLKTVLPRVEVRVGYDTMARVQQAVLRNEVDLGLVPCPRHLPGLAVEIIRQVPFVLVCLPEHPFARLPLVTLGQLKGQPLIVWTQLPWRPLFKAVPRHERSHYRPRHQFNAIEPLKQALKVEGGVPPDPTAPLDMTTRITNLQTAITNYEDGGTQALNERNMAWEAVDSGLDALGFYAQTVGRFNLPLFLASGFQVRSKNRGQSKLDTPSIAGIDNDSPTELDVHVTTVTNALNYEVQICIGTADWKTAMFSSQARTITLTGLTTGTVYNVRVRALGGSTGQSDWSMPGSSIVD